MSIGMRAKVVCSSGTTRDGLKRYLARQLYRHLATAYKTPSPALDNT